MSGSKIQSVTQTSKLFGMMEVYKLRPSVKTAKLVVFNLPPKTPKYKNIQPLFFGFLLSYANLFSFHAHIYYNTLAKLFQKHAFS